MAEYKWNQNRVLSLLMVLLGNLLYAFTVKLFLLPANLISCGTMGIAFVVNHLTGISLTGFIFVFNMVMLAIGWWLLGRKFAMTTVLSSLLYPILLVLNVVAIGNIGSVVATVITSFVLGAVPAIILLVIYFACRSGRGRKSELDKMNMSDL